MSINIYEILGLIGSFFICASMIWKTTTFKGTLLMRIINSLGCVLFIIYGCVLPAYSTALANICCLFINVILLIDEIKGRTK